MSLTSYRAAPPRVKPLRAFRKCRGRWIRADAVGVACSPVPKASLEGNPGAKPVGCEGYVPTRAAFGKGCGRRFFRLYDRRMARIPADLPHTCQKFHKRPACGNKTEAKRRFGEDRLEQYLGCPRAPRCRARRTPSMPWSRGRGPSRRLICAERLDRLARLRAVVADNEERFRQAISADFGHRSAVETNIAETMMVFSEIRHADKTPEELDGAAARRDRAAIPARAQPADAAAARRRRHHRALELSAAADARARDRRDRRRQPRHHQAERTRAALLGAAEGDGRAKIRRRPSCSSPASRTRSQRPSRRCRSITGVHRLDPGRPAGRGGRGAQSDAGHARARRQVAGDHRRLRRSRRGGRAHRLRQAAQCRADLHRAGLCAGAGARVAGLRREGARADAAHVRHRSRQQGLHLDHLRPALCAAGRPRRGCRATRRKDPAAGEGGRSELEGAPQIPADADRRRDRRRWR